MTCECFDIGDTHTGEREQVATKRLSRYQSSEYQSAQRVDRMQLVGKRYSSSVVVVTVVVLVSVVVVTNSSNCCCWSRINGQQ